MRVIEVRNAHQALPRALRMLDEEGIRRESRAGTVLEFPEPVVTVYSRPEERVIFWPERDYNIAFVLYEALWMLSGRDDLEPLTRYVKDFGKFSDDGRKLHGAYGRRWRKFSEDDHTFDVRDQLSIIVERLKKDPKDRRCVLQIWDARLDLDSPSKDVPCNDMATFQIDSENRLNMTVFCRSNDVLWGCYYANAFHFGFLMEYMAARIGCKLGTYSQVSVNWHGYLNTLEQVKALPRPPYMTEMGDPYGTGQVSVPPLSGNLDALIGDLVVRADKDEWWSSVQHNEPWYLAAFAVLKAHSIYRLGDGEDKFRDSLLILNAAAPYWDWVHAMKSWIQRRRTRWENRRTA